MIRKIFNDIVDDVSISEVQQLLNQPFGRPGMRSENRDE